ncbi:hypothetical protein HNR12_002458 [Streptomonospora nanhaiensis]|uniref:Chitinase n=1 Tax=Streptomonospora nanhaiensis TaxID=1323731 RepID=A0A853BNT9_9ACTN|nr:hypothetical protein [Streptomonospora nanhaiensis]
MLKKLCAVVALAVTAILAPSVPAATADQAVAAEANWGWY